MWLLAYNFELRLPKVAGAEFVRFDLNPPWETDRDEMRCHLHPGDEGLRAPSPLMSPLELAAARPLLMSAPNAPTPVP